VIEAETPVLSSVEACMLLDSIEPYTLIGPGDGALIVTMVYSFTRVSAAVTMKPSNCFQHRKRCWLRLH
jgi:integrase/recombinase XerD